MIKTLSMHNKATTTRYNGVGSMCGLHSIVSCCCGLIVHNECKDHSPRDNISFARDTRYVAKSSMHGTRGDGSQSYSKKDARATWPNPNEYANARRLYENLTLHEVCSPPGSVTEGPALSKKNLYIYQ
jgi:hypothetical protein